MRQFIRFLHSPFRCQHQPVGDIVVQRTIDLTKRHATLRTTRGLHLGIRRIEITINLVKIGNPGRALRLSGIAFAVDTNFNIFDDILILPNASTLAPGAAVTYFVLIGFNEPPSTRLSMASPRSPHRLICHSLRLISQYLLPFLPVYSLIVNPSRCFHVLTRNISPNRTYFAAGGSQS